MGDLLQELLNEVVVTPYDKDITNRLAAVCDSLAEDVTVKGIDPYIASFVFNKPDWDFKKEVEKKYKEMFPDQEHLNLPPLFAIVLSQYITIQVIVGKFKGRDQATASLILMNYMLYRKGSLSRLILPDHIGEMFYKHDDYIAEKDVINTEEELKHIGDILSSPNYIVDHYSEDDVKKEIRVMAKMAALYQQQFIIDKYKRTLETNPFIKVYCYLVDITNNAKWLFMKNDIKQLLMKVTREDEQKKQVSIEGIISELVKADVIVPYESLEESSLLLNYISMKESIPEEIRSRRLTVMEFGVYVYYELLLEHIIDKYYGS